MKKFNTLFVTALFALAGAAMPAAAGTDHGSKDASTMNHGAMSATAGADMSDGEVRKIDKEQGKITLRHGPIKSLDMPGMTMVFTVADKAMLDAVKRGDKVKFKVANANGQMTVTEMMPAQ